MDKPKNGLDFLEVLRSKNMNKTLAHRAVSDYLDAKAREKGVPIHGQFELTPFCNFDCKMCYVHLNADQLNCQEILPVEKWKNLMHQAFEMGMMAATLTGGECLAYSGFDEIFLYLHSLGCEVSVLTNGYFLDDQRIEFFRRHMPSSIKVSLYGWNDAVYERVTGFRAFETVIKNIYKAIEARLPIALSITPSSYLGEDVFETIRFARGITNNLSINSSLFTPREETGRSNLVRELDTDLYIRIYRLLNEIYGIDTEEIDDDLLPAVGGPLHESEDCGLQCGGGRSTFVLNWKGTLMPCNRLNMIYAYPLKEGFKEAWGKINCEVNSWPRVPECQGCMYYTVCNKCAAKMLQYAKPGKQPYGLCEQTKLFVKYGIAHLPEC